MNTNDSGHRAPWSSSRSTTQVRSSFPGRHMGPSNSQESETLRLEPTISRSGFSSLWPPSPTGATARSTIRMVP